MVNFGDRIRKRNPNRPLISGMLWFLFGDGSGEDFSKEMQKFIDLIWR